MTQRWVRWAMMWKAKRVFPMLSISNQNPLRIELKSLLNVMHVLASFSFEQQQNIPYIYFLLSLSLSHSLSLCCVTIKDVVNMPWINFLKFFLRALIWVIWLELKLKTMLNSLSLTLCLLFASFSWLLSNYLFSFVIDLLIKFTH
jgi:hypothetical protein